MNSYDVLLAGYYGFGNLGDELLAQSAIGLLLSFGVERGKIAILSNNPDESKEKFGIDAVNRWKLSAVREALMRSRTLLLGGGGLFQDATSMRSCVYYWGLVRLARAARCRVWAVGQSVGPLLSPAAKWLTKTAFAACAYIGVRDESSRALLAGYGLASELTPDLVFALDVPPLSERGRTVLINVRPARDLRWRDRITQAAREISERGFPLRGIAFAEEDARELESLAVVGVKPGDIVSPVTERDFLRYSDDAFAAVGMRLHFGILSYRRGLAVLMAPYDPKVSGFAQQCGLSLLPDEDKKDDSVIMPILRECPNASFGASGDDACGCLRSSFFKAAEQLLGEISHG